MSRCRYAALVMLVLLVFPAGCGSSRNQTLRDPVARSGASSEELWYRNGGARVAYTAVVRPRHLYAGYGTAPDPALYGQMPATTQPAPQKRSTPKPRATPPKTPECPPCPPADAMQKAPSQTNPASSAPVQDTAGAGSQFPAAPPQGAADSTPPVPATFPPQGASGSTAPFPAALLPQGTGSIPATTPLPPRLPLPAMPAATPAPGTPGR
jgi:hypothetical protein